MPHQLVVWTHYLSTEARMFIEKPIENISNDLAMLHLHPHLYISSLLYISCGSTSFLSFKNHKTIVSIPLPLGLNFSAPPSSFKMGTAYLWLPLQIHSVSMATFLPPTQVVGFSSFVLDFQQVITIITVWCPPFTSAFYAQNYFANNFTYII